MGMKIKIIIQTEDVDINGKPDPSYRYKMTPISATINGKGNGVYTTILNLNEVCKDINQPPIVILKFLSLNFGSMCNEEKGTITGGYKNEEIQKALQEKTIRSTEIIEQEFAQQLLDAGFESVDYIAFADPKSLEPIIDLSQTFVVLVAAFIGGVRLIDNQLFPHELFKRV